MNLSRRLYGQFTSRILEALNDSESNPQHLEGILDHFRKADVLPRAVLFKALTDQDHEVIDRVHKMFGKEIGMAVLKYVSSGISAEPGAEEIERELTVWQQIWEKRDQGGI